MSKPDEKKSSITQGAEFAGKDAAEDAISYFSLFNCDALDYIGVALGVLGSLANAPVMPMFAFVFGELIDTFTDPANALDSNKLAKEVSKISIWFVTLAGVTSVASFLEVALFMWSGSRQVARLRQRYLAASLNQEQEYYDTQATSGDVLSGLNEDCQAVQNAISEKVGNAIHHVGTFVVSVGIALYRGWKLALVMLALMPLIAAAGAVLAKLMTAGTSMMAKGYAKANVSSTQAVANIRTVASFQAEEKSLETYSDLLEEPRKTQTKISTYSGMAGGFVNCVVFITYGVAFLYGNKLVRNPGSGYTAGKVMSVIFASIIGGFSLGQAAPNFPAFATGRVAGARIYRLINRKPLIDVHAEGQVPTTPLQGNIEMKGVSFAYPARADVSVFTSLDLSVAAGQTVALVGQSGSGKSTIIQLLERFYDPAAGSITIDGHDIRSLCLGWYRDHVGLVSQEPTLFATSIRENIAMGRAGCSEKDIQEAAQAASAHSFITKLPQGYSTQVGEKGVQLSGGQKQRVAIARALLKNPGILLLDEATSALDTVSERLVQAALERLARGRTTLVVAHRLSTIRNADKIAVVQGGKIVEQGSHVNLFAQEDSVYHSLVKLQEQAMDKRANDAGEVEGAEDGDLIPSANPSGRQLASRKSLDSHRSIDVPELKVNKDDDKEELSEEEKDVKVKFTRLLGLARPEWLYIIAGILASAVLGCVMPLFAVFLSSLIVALNPTEPKSTAIKYAIGFFALGIGMLIMATIQGFTFAVVGSNIAIRVRKMFFRAALYMEVGWFDQDMNTSGALSSRLASDAPAVRGAVSDVMGVTVQNLVTLVVGYIIAFVNGWRMTLLITAVLPLLGFSSWMQIKFFSGLDNKGGRLFARANQTAHEGIMALRTVHSYNMQEKVARIYRSMLEGPNKKALVNALKSGLAFGASQAIMFLFYALAFWFGGTEVRKGRMNLEEMLKVFFAILLASMGISQAQVAFPDVAKGQSAVKRIFRVVDRKTLIDASTSRGETPASAQGVVELRNVTFAYPTRPDVNVFKNFSLSVAPGKVTALVGESGSGKSTIANLVERFYDVSEGQVLIDGIDIRQLNLQWLRSKVALVSQEPSLFNGTILENVRLGKPAATISEVEMACDIANAREFIDRQPDGFGTLLGEGGGISLSGGQKQRIAIARAVLKDPSILLLDEATSALDAESERLVQGALDKLMVGRTSIVIAHRLTTVRNADTIAVVQSGVVLEQGSHNELMAKGAGGAYVKLARAQAGV